MDVKDHAKNTELTTIDDELVTCLRCKKRVKRKNLKRHYMRIHKAELKNEASLYPMKAEQSTSDMAKEMRQALRSNLFASDYNIADYIERHPEKDRLGMFGLPQDKNRWGAFGSSSSKEQSD